MNVLLTLLLLTSSILHSQDTDLIFTKTLSTSSLENADLELTTTQQRSLGYLLYTDDSTTPLLAGEEYCSGAIDIAEFSMISTIITGSPSTATGTLHFEFSPDGTHWDRNIIIPVEDLANEPPHTLLPIAVFFRVRYINGPIDQTTMRLQTVFHRNSSKGLTSRLEGPINSTTDVDNVRSVIVGKNPKNNYENTRQDGSAFRTTTNLGGTTLSGELTLGATGIKTIFTDLSGFASSGYMYIDSEFIGYSTNNLTDTLTITERGAFGTTDATHSLGATAGEAYTSGLLTLDGYTEVATKMLCSNTGRMRFQWYADAEGSHLIRTIAPPYATVNLYDFLAAPNFGPYVRYTFANTQPFNTTNIYFETEFYTKAISAQVLTLDSPMVSGMTSNLTRAILVGRNESGNYENVNLGSESSLQVTLRDPITSFDVLSVASVTPLAKVKWPYPSLNNDFISIKHGSGSIISNNNEIKIETGTTTESFGMIRTEKYAQYQSGQGMEIRFGARFSAGVAGTTQVAGLGDQEEGIFFGYNGTDFGVMRRYGGKLQIHSLSLTNDASDDGNVTITLNGIDTIISITDNDTRGIIGKKIAQADYSATGFTAHYEGDKIVFASDEAKPHTGSFSTTQGSLDVLGTFTQIITGTVPSEEWTLQSVWNKDKAFSEQLLPIIDFTKNNVFRIRYKWLGSGTIEFSLENPDSGKFVRTHISDYSNIMETPFLNNPSLPLSLIVNNKLTTANLTVASSSMGAFVEGQIKSLGVDYNFYNQKNVPRNTEQAIFSARVPYTIDTQSNKTPAQILSYSCGTLNNKNALYRVYKDAYLVGSPSFSAAADSHLIEIDTNATAINGGRLIHTNALPKYTRADNTLNNANTVLNPGEILTFTAENLDNGNAKCNVSIDWKEEI